SFVRTVSTSDKPSDDIIVRSNERNSRSADIYRLNTKSGFKTLLTFDNPGNVVRWVLDHDNVVRGALSFDEKEGYTSFYRDAADAPWRKLTEFKRDGPGYYPWGFEGDNRTLLVVSNIGRDKNAIFKFDFEKEAVGELVIGHEAVDVTGGLIYDREKKKHVGIHINAEKPETFWFDPEWANAQKLADSVLPETVNLLSRREGSQLYFVTSRSDTH